MRQHLSASALSVLFIVLFASLVHADGKITTDPNAPGARPAVQQAIPQDEDDALSKKITYDGPDLDLTTMLSQVSKLSGVRMQPSSAKDNWQVRQRTAIVFISEAPLSEFRDGLAKLFDYRWRGTKAEDGKRTYILTEPEIKKSARQAKLDAAKQAEIDANLANTQAAVDAAAKSTNLTAEELKEARENDPWLYYLAANPTGRKWAEVIKLIPYEWWEQAACGKERDIEATSTGPLEQKIIGLLDQIRTFPPTGTSLKGHSYDDAHATGYNYGREEPLRMLTVRQGLLCVFTRKIRYDANGDYFMATQQIESCPISSSRSLACRVVGTRAIMAEGGRGLDETMQAALDKECNRSYADYVDPKPDPATDPALLREIEHKPLADPNKKDEPTLISHLRGLSQETGFTMMVETFDHPDLARKTAWCDSKGTIFSMLTDIGKISGTAWEKSGNVILFRYRDWPKLRSLEVSCDLIRRWEDSVKDHGYLNLADRYDIISNTTTEQIEATLLKSDLLKMAGIERLIHDISYAPLRAATALSEADRRLFFAEGIPLKLFDQNELRAIGTESEFISSLLATEQDSTVSAQEQSDSAGLKKFVLNIRRPDGNSRQFVSTLASPGDIQAVRDYLKSLEQAAPTPAARP